MKEHIDVELDDVITAQVSLTDAAGRISERLRQVACGATTACETLGEVEVAISRIRQSI